MAPSASPAPPLRSDREAQGNRLWRWPGVLGVLTLSGLLSALVSDGWGDAWSWAALGVPVAVMVWFGVLRRTGAGR